MPELLKNDTNVVWQEQLSLCLLDSNYTVSPRGMEVRERISGSYVVPMPAYLDLKDRKVNVPFMFAEAAWIVSGSNRLADVTPYMKAYSNFSDDGAFLRGAYGPKVVDQLGYVADTLIADRDSRQAVINIWRERPGPSKDIPCTLSMQFLIRDQELQMVVTMRSQDIVLGFTYDVFTFSMIAMAVQQLIHDRNQGWFPLGNLHVNAGSLHIYERHYEDAEKWIKSTQRDLGPGHEVQKLCMVQNYDDLIVKLKEGADNYGEAA